jgi:hypothetical protein
MKKAKELERGFAPVSFEDPEKAAAYLRLVIDTIPALAAICVSRFSCSGVKWTSML